MAWLAGVAGKIGLEDGINDVKIVMKQGKMVSAWRNTDFEKEDKDNMVKFNRKGKTYECDITALMGISAEVGSVSVGGGSGSGKGNGDKGDGDKGSDEDAEPVRNSVVSAISDW